MYGLVNAAFRELIVSNYGHATWEKIHSGLSVDFDEFSSMQQYSDELTTQMVTRGAQFSGASEEQLLIRFGEFWVEYTERQGYGALFDIAGDSLGDFLLSLDELHARVGRNFPKLRPPSFRFDVLSRDKMRMHYLTHRTGLCPFVVGLLQGLSIRFRTPLAIESVACQKDGADHCVFLLRLNDRG